MRAYTPLRLASYPLAGFAIEPRLGLTRRDFLSMSSYRLLLMTLDCQSEGANVMELKVRNKRCVPPRNADDLFRPFRAPILFLYRFQGRCPGYYISRLQRD